MSTLRPCRGSPRSVSISFFRVRVARADDGGRLGWAAAAKRWALPGVPLYLPYVLLQPIGILVYLSAYLRPSRRGLHDRVAGTTVVRTA